jgi:hypothetical protein
MTEFCKCYKEIEMEEVYGWYSPNRNRLFPVYYYGRLNDDVISGISAIVYYSNRYIDRPSWCWKVLRQKSEETDLTGCEEHMVLAMLRVEIALGVMPVVRPSNIVHTDTN